MTERYENMLIEIAKKHGVVLGKNDPILIVYTLNMRMIEDQTQAQSQLFDEFRSQLEEATDSWHKEANSRAEKILSASLEASKKAMINAMSEHTKTASDTIIEDFQHLIDKLDNKIKESRSVSYINIAASLFTLVAACAVLFGFIWS